MKKGDVSKLLGVSTRTIDRWMKNRWIPFHKSFNGRVTFDPKEIEEWVRRNGLGKKDSQHSTSK